VTATGQAPPQHFRRRASDDAAQLAVQASELRWTPPSRSLRRDAATGACPVGDLTHT